MSQFFLFLLTLFIACSIGLCRNSSSQVNTCFTWFVSSDSMECKHFLYVSFFFCSSLSSYFSCSLFLYFAPFLNFSTICPAEFLLPTIGLSLLSALTFSSVASPFSPQHFHSTFFSPFFSKLSFNLDFLFRISCSLSLHFSQVLSQASCAVGDKYEQLSFSTSSTPACYKEIDHRSPVCPILNAEFSMVMFEL